MCDGALPECVLEWKGATKNAWALEAARFAVLFAKGKEMAAL